MSDTMIVYVIFEQTTDPKTGKIQSINLKEIDMDESSAASYSKLYTLQSTNKKYKTHKYLAVKVV